MVAVAVTGYFSGLLLGALVVGVVGGAAGGGVEWRRSAQERKMEARSVELGAVLWTSSAQPSVFRGWVANACGRFFLIRGNKL